MVSIPLVRGGAVPGVWLACLALLVLGSFEALAPLGTALAQLGRARAAGRRMFELVDLPPAVAEPVAPQPLPDAFTLAFEDVSFAYDPQSAPALEVVSFTLRPSGRVAIVGRSGSGKSTLARLALRIADPTGGAIRLGGLPLPSYALDALRGNIALVPQSPYLFADTLRRNLLLGRPDACEDDLQDATAAAQLDAVIAGLPQGLDTPLGENGVTLSGGERQRVAIARALLTRPRLLILDEATANLDPLTERAVLRAIRARMEGQGMLVISHRLVELEHMDEILVLDRGRVVERGTYTALVAAGGPFSQWLAAQDAMLVASH
jgi:ABC-type multidrug transport system fused ATPase/permease subunit